MIVTIQTSFILGLFFGIGVGMGIATFMILSIQKNLKKGNKYGSTKM